MRWKQLEELEKQRIEQIKKDTEDARLKLEDEMQNALYEYQAEQIRQGLFQNVVQLKVIVWIFKRAAEWELTDLRKLKSRIEDFCIT